MPLIRRRSIIRNNAALHVPAGGVGAGAEFIGTATILNNGYSAGNKTFTANGGVNLPACLFVCVFSSGDATNPSTFQIGATNLAKVSSDSSNVLQLWAAVYAGGSDTVTCGNGNAFAVMGMAAGWSTKSVTATAVSPQSATVGSTFASAASPMVLASACVVPASGIGFVVGMSRTAQAANNKNWGSVESSPVPSDHYSAATNSRLSLACKSSAGSWSPTFWGSTNADANAYNYAAGLAACAFGP